MKHGQETGIFKAKSSPIILIVKIEIFASNRVYLIDGKLEVPIG